MALLPSGIGGNIHLMLLRGIMNTIILNQVSFEESRLVAMTLSQQNIETAIVSTTKGRWREPCYTVLVEKDNYANAKEIAERILLTEVSNSKWELKTCLECDSTNLQKLNRGFIKEIFSFRNKFKCNDCGYSWKT